MMMKKNLLSILLFFTAFLVVPAQNNPYDIDDRCYIYYSQADAITGQEGFQEAAGQLLVTAREVGDEKAETLYYVLVLKDLTRKKSTPQNDQAVEEAFTQLKDFSREKGFEQYYYYAYQLTQTYYFNNGHQYKTYQLIQEMQQTALQEKDAYGLWTSDRYMASLYISQNDYMSAKPYILQALHTYDTTHDETVRRQSPSRLYCDLADTYPIGSDSVHINVERALRGAKTHADTLRCRYYQARLAALNNEVDRYRELRDYCLNDPQITQVSRHADVYFSLIDAVFDGTIAEHEDQVVGLRAIREMKVIANLCENQDYDKFPTYKDFAFNLEKKLVQRFEVALSNTNQSRVSELDVSMGKAALSADLEHKEHEIDRISHLLLMVLAALLAAVAIFLWLHIRNLQASNRKVRMADAAKTRFIQNMSHEVRTPLNAIVGFSQLLSLPDGTLEPEEKEEFSGHIVNNTKMLTMLLDDILNVSAMDNGEYSIVYESGEINTMAREAISSSEHRLQPGVSLHYIPCQEEPYSFTTDPRRVQQILINLLTNACKHTKEGEITLASSLTDKPGYVTYIVTDTGTGIPASEADKIFERFTKLDEFVQGTGLGLSICRDIADRLGAEVFLDTTHQGPGARFVFRIPIKSPTETINL